MRDRRNRRRIVVGAAALGLALALGASSLLALTPPETGAVARPDGLDISWPFESGERVYLTSGYGPNGGSSLHAGTNRSGSANDHHALDLTLPDRSSGGLGRPVLAVAPGTVVRSGWATSGWRNYGLRVIIRHDFNADGHTYHSLYAHLNAVALREGDHVDRGQRIGDLGGSCDGDNQVLDCPTFGPHLHFALHQDSSVGGSGTGGSYGGRAVVPEVIDGAQDLRQGQSHVSRNNGQPPRPCAEIGDTEVVLEEDGPCGRAMGPPQYWHDQDGHGGHSLWTYTIADAEPDNWVRWELNFAGGGRYQVAAWVPDGSSDTQRGAYRVRHEGREDEAVRSQAGARGQWLELGEFQFSGGADQWVELRDNTGEPYTDENGTKLSFDALRVRPVREDPPDVGTDTPDDMGVDAPADTAGPDVPGDVDPDQGAPDIGADVAPDTPAPDVDGDDVRLIPGDRGPDEEVGSNGKNRVSASAEGCAVGRSSTRWWILLRR